MAWTAPTTRATGDIITASIWNTDLVDNLAFLGTHVHSGAAGDGGSSLGPLVKADFTTAAAPAAPGASKGRFYVVTGDRPGFRSGAAGAAEQIATLAGTETLTNKTLTAPTIGDFTNASHDHGDADDGGAVFGLPVIVPKTADETISSNSTLQNDDHLLRAMLANEIWEFRFVLRFSWANATPDLKATLEAPSGAVVNWRTHAIAAGGTELSIQYINDIGTVATWETGSSAMGADTPAIIVIEGIVVNGANAGNLQLQWAQNTSNGSDTKILAGSVLILHKVA